MQFTALRRQHPSCSRWRRKPGVPFEIAVPGRLEGELRSLGLPCGDRDCMRRLRMRWNWRSDAAAMVLRHWWFREVAMIKSMTKKDTFAQRLNKIMASKSTEQLRGRTLKRSSMQPRSSARIAPDLGRAPVCR